MIKLCYYVMRQSMDGIIQILQQSQVSHDHTPSILDSPMILCELSSIKPDDFLQ